MFQECMCKLNGDTVGIIDKDRFIYRTFTVYNAIISRRDNPKHVSGCCHKCRSLHPHSEFIQYHVQTRCECHSLFYSLLHLQHTQPPIPSFPLSSLLFSFPLISHSPLLYLHVTLISLSTGLWDVCVCVRAWGGGFGVLGIKNVCVSMCVLC